MQLGRMVLPPRLFGDFVESDFDLDRVGLEENSPLSATAAPLLYRYVQCHYGRAGAMRTFSDPMDGERVPSHCGKIRNGRMPTSSAPLRQAGSFGIGGGKRIVVADDFAES